MYDLKIYPIVMNCNNLGYLLNEHVLMYSDLHLNQKFYYSYSAYLQRSKR